MFASLTFSVLPKTANLVFDWSELLIFCCNFALIISSYQESNLENLVNQIKTKAQNVLSETCDIHQSTDYENQYFCWLKLILTPYILKWRKKIFLDLIFHKGKHLTKLMTLLCRLFILCKINTFCKRNRSRRAKRLKNGLKNQP